MTLEAHVAENLSKLQRRLAGQGVTNLASMDYEVYLRSTLWKKIRDWVFERDDVTCAICGRKRKNAQLEAFSVHHRNYDIATLEGRDDKQLVTLCHRCHERVEFFANGNKRTSIIEKENELGRLVELHKSILMNGLPLRIREERKHGCTSYFVTYQGPQEYLEFFSFESLMANFLFEMFRENDKTMRISLPLKSDKFRNASGVSLRETSTNKVIVKVMYSDSGATVKLSRGCTYSVEAHLRRYFIAHKPWHMES